jgi:hypothetical protein
MSNLTPVEQSAEFRQAIVTLCSNGPIKIAIVGSRRYPYSSVVRDFVNGLPADSAVVSGHNGNVDLTAETAAKARLMPVISFPPDWKRYGRTAAFKRNQQVADACDLMVAFWDGKSGGTVDAMERTRKLGKLAYFIGYDDDADTIITRFRVMRAQRTVGERFEA